MEVDEESPSGANKEKEENEVVTVMIGRFALATESLPPNIIEEMEKRFLRLGFPQTLASLSDEDITMIWDVIRRPSGLVSDKMLDRGNQISVLAAKHLKLIALHSRQWNVAPRPMTFNVITAQLCCSNSNNGSWNRKG